MIALLLALVLTQESARDLVERLQSDEPAAREEATRKLAAMGKAAEAELRKAVNHPEAEVAGRVRRLLRRLEIADSLTPRLQAAVPGVLARLLSEQPHEWTAVFLQAQAIPGLRRPDLEPLAAPAVRGAGNGQELFQVLSTVQARKLRSAAPEVARRFNDPTYGGQVCSVYRELEGRASIPVFVGLLKSPVLHTRVQALDSLVRLDAVEAIPDIREFMKTDTTSLRSNAAEAYARLAGRDALAELRAMAKDRDYQTAEAGLKGLAATGLREAGPDILRGFQDEHLRGTAALAAADLRLKEAMPLIVALARGKEEDERYDAIEALATYATRAAARELVPLLSDKDEGIRAEALQSFAKIRIREGASEIAKLVSSEQEDVREGAIELLAMMGAKEAYDEVAKGLKNPAKDARLSVMNALGAIDPPRAARQFVPLLANDDEWELVQDWIYNSEPKAAEPELAAMLKSAKDEKVRERIEDLLFDLFELPESSLLEKLESKDAITRASALEGLKSAGSAPAAARRLKDAEPEVRAAAVRALERLKSGELRSALADSDPEVLVQAIRGTAAVKPPDAARDLLPLLRHAVMLVRQEAAEALGRLAAEEAAPAMIELAGSPLPYVRASAAQGLSGLKAPEARAAVETLRQDPHPYVRRMAGGFRPGAPTAEVPSSVPELAALLEEADSSLVKAALEKLIGIGTKESVAAAARGADLRNLALPADAAARFGPWVAELLDDPDEDVRARGAGAVAAVGAKAAVPRLVERLGGRSTEAILLALGELGAREAIAKMLPFLGHRRGPVRVQAAESLARLGAKEAEGALIELLEDAEADVRRAAALALGELGSERAVPKLVEKLVDEDVTAAAALCLLGRPEGVPVLLAVADEAVRLEADFLNYVDLGERPVPLFALHALRAPELRRTLEAKPFIGPAEASVLEITQAAASAAGMAHEESLSHMTHFGVTANLHGRSLWGALLALSAAGSTYGGQPEMIVEDGKIRLVDLHVAVRYWTAWYEQQKK